MVEKRRGLGRGLGALIPSAPMEEVPEPAPERKRGEQAGSSAEGTTGAPRPQGTRPVDLFFESVGADVADDAPRSYSSALKSGIDKNVRDAQTKKVAKSKDRIDAAAATLAYPAPSPNDGDDTTTSSSVSRETRRTSAAAAASSGSSARGQSAPELVDVPGASFAEVDLAAIRANRRQPRVEFDEDELSELVHSIREVGVLQPVVVRPLDDGGPVAYELVMGERRWRASKEAGLTRIPAIIRSTLDDDLLRDALLENLHRSALNPLEEAAAYQQLLDDFSCSHEELAGRLGRSRPQISNTLRLLRLPPLVQRRVAAGVLSAGHSRALLGLSDPAEMERLAQRIVAEGLSVRSTEEIVAMSSGLRQAPKASRPAATARHERLDYLATSLSDRLDTNVKISLGAKKGRVSIEFASVDDLNRIIGVIAPSGD
ncbi:ParB/RepB/Spo0J family partition protein [Arthrobacter echini]|uniref:ParB/RepB/Spo0J family partition protein n=1 Tax=Arthrobacter echini TaxID=1529066 RepID=A0A4S5EAS3_9MICC|nr:ParB/RepB/Spo0J family partition protein [Arthrobacter echini]THJ68703.1 ParB/RepB/Spo0J family partition protein [Arthrobacter echini]